MTQPQLNLVLRLVESEKPADVIHAGAACLGQVLDGFVWVRSRQTLECNRGGRREVMGLMKSKHNRSGQLIQFMVESLTVFDDALGAWRRASPDLTVRRPESVESIVCSASLLDLSGQHFVDLTRPERRVAKLDQFADHLRETALRWFASSTQTQQLAREVPAALLSPWGFAQDLMEFLVSRDDLAEARALWARVHSLNPKHHEALETGQSMAEAGDRPRWHTPEALGWSAAVLELL